LLVIFAFIYGVRNKLLNEQLEYRKQSWIKRLFKRYK